MWAAIASSSGDARRSRRRPGSDDARARAQRGKGQPTATGDQQRPLDDVLQLAHVARPVVLLHPLEVLGRHGRYVRKVERPRDLRSTKCMTREGMSSRRRRSGGMRIDTFRRYHRSSRKRPWRTICSRSRWVAAMTRTSTFTGSLPPTRSKRFSSSTRSSLTCAPGLVHRPHPGTGCPVGPLEAACLRSVAPVNAPRSCPKAPVEQRLGDGPALHGDHGPVAARRREMNGVGDDLLAGPGLAEKQRGAAGGSHLPHLFHHRAQPEVRPDHLHTDGPLDVGREGPVVLCEEIPQLTQLPVAPGIGHGDGHGFTHALDKPHVSRRIAVVTRQSTARPSGRPSVPAAGRGPVSGDARKTPCSAGCRSSGRLIARRGASCPLRVCSAAAADGKLRLR